MELGEPPGPRVRPRRATREEVPEETLRAGCWGTRLTFFGLCPSWPWSFSFGPGARALRERRMGEGPMEEGGGGWRENAGRKSLRLRTERGAGCPRCTATARLSAPAGARAGHEASPPRPGGCGARGGDGRTPGDAAAKGRAARAKRLLRAATSSEERRPAPTRGSQSFLVAEAAPQLTFPLHGETGNRQAPAHSSDGDSGSRRGPNPSSSSWRAQAPPPGPPGHAPARVRSGHGAYHLLQGGLQRSREDRGGRPKPKPCVHGSGFSGRAGKRGALRSSCVLRKVGAPAVSRE